MSIVVHGLDGWSGREEGRNFGERSPGGEPMDGPVELGTAREDRCLMSISEHEKDRRDERH